MRKPWSRLEWLLVFAGTPPLVLAGLAFARVLPEWLFISIPYVAWVVLVIGGVPLGLGLVLFPLTRRLAAGAAWWIPLGLLALGWIAWWNLLDPLGSERGGYAFLNRGGLIAMAVGCVVGFAVNIVALYAPARPPGGTPRS